MAVYEPSPSDGQLRQGEILSDLIQVRIKLESIGSSEGYKGLDVVHPYCIVVTQDCDLEQDFRAREGDETKIHRLLPNILFCEVELAQDVRFGDQNENLPKEKKLRSKEINSKVWPNIQQNRDERYHYLQKVLPEYDRLQEGLDELVIEFKRYFTIPTDEVYLRIAIEETKRRCKLSSPYLEHFSTRFHYYHYRIALPEQHLSE